MRAAPDAAWMKLEGVLELLIILCVPGTIALMAVLMVLAMGLTGQAQLVTPAGTDDV